MRTNSVPVPAGHVLLALLLAMLLSDVARGSGDYQLGPGDLLRVTVFGSPELSGETRVSESGSISYPLIGQIAVAGRSPAQVEAMLSAHFIEGGYLREPQVSVLVTEYRSQKVAVLGHVVKPGQYMLQSSSRLLDMLAAAGGVVNDEAGDVATLVRKDGSRHTIDLPALFSGDPQQNAPVSGGDTIYVPRAPQFYVYGEVSRPGMYRLERNMTVSRAISTGGGLTQRGSERRVIVKRRNGDGTEQELQVHGSDTLEPDDVLFVKERMF